MVDGQVEAVPVQIKSTSPIGGGSGTLVSVAGCDLASFSRSLTLEMGVGRLATLNVEMLARNGLNVTLPAAVIVNVSTLPGYSLTQETLADGSRRWSAKRDEVPTRINTTGLSGEIETHEKL